MTGTWTLTADTDLLDGTTWTPAQGLVIRPVDATGAVVTITDATNKIVFSPGDQTFTQTAGAFSITLPASDAGLSPTYFGFSVWLSPVLRSVIVPAQTTGSSHDLSEFVSHPSTIPFPPDQVAVLTAEIVAEAALRVTGDATNATAIASEATTRASADTTETAARIAGDALKADKTTTVNGHALSGNVTLTPSDVGAQPVAANLTTIAALDTVSPGVAATDGTGWIRKTYAQLKTALGLVKADVGLGSVDNTADTAKPVSVAQQAALDLKAPLASPALTGTPTVPTPVSSDNSTTIASTAYVTTAVDAGIAGGLKFRGTFDASVNAFPSTGGSGTAGAIRQGDLWVVSVAGTTPGGAVTPGDLIIAKTDAPGVIAGNWDQVEHDLTYAPENVANKSTDGTLAANSDTLYPSQKATKTYADTGLATKVPTTRQVNGHPLSADVTVTKADVGLGSADNTSDANKPVSTAQATADTAVQTAAATDATTKANAAQAAAIAASDPTGSATTAQNNAIGASFLFGLIGL